MTWLDGVGRASYRDMVNLIRHAMAHGALNVRAHLYIDTVDAQCIDKSMHVTSGKFGAQVCCDERIAVIDAVSDQPVDVQCTYTHGWLSVFRRSRRRC